MIGVVAILVTIAVVVIVGISGANKTAKEYTSAAKLYLEDVADAMAGSANSPADIQDDVKDIDRPELKKSIFGGISSEYKKAQQTQTRVGELVDETSADLKKYGEFETSAKKVKKAYDELNVSVGEFLSSVEGMQSRSMTAAKRMVASVTVMDSSCTKLTEQLKSVDAPKSAKSDATAYRDATTTLCKSISDMKSALENQDADDLTAAMDDFSDASGDYGDIVKRFFEHTSNSAKEVKKLADPIQVLADTL